MEKKKPPLAPRVWNSRVGAALVLGHAAHAQWWRRLAGSALLLLGCAVWCDEQVELSLAANAPRVKSCATALALKSRLVPVPSLVSAPRSVASFPRSGKSSLCCRQRVCSAEAHLLWPVAVSATNNALSLRLHSPQGPYVSMSRPQRSKFASGGRTHSRPDPLTEAHADCPSVLVRSHSCLAICPGLQCLGSCIGGFLSTASRLNAGGAIGNGSCVGVFVREDDGRLRYTVCARTTESHATLCTRGRRRAALHCAREDDGRGRCTVRAGTAEGGTALCAMRMNDNMHRISSRRCDPFTSVDKRLMKS